MRKRRLMALEPRVLLDAAGVVSGVDAYAQSAENFQQSGQQDNLDHHAGDVPPATAIQHGAAKTGTDDEVAGSQWTLSEQADQALLSIDGQALLVVDTGIANYQSLLEQLDPDTEVLLLDSGSDGLLQLQDYLTGRHDISAIHILSHGGKGSLQLGSTLLDAASLPDYQPVLAQIGQSLAADGDILLYGCEVGEDFAGVEFVSSLAVSTGADIAASTDLTGSAAEGGDWELEYTSGPVSASSLAFTSYDGTLGFSTTDHNGDSKADPIRMITWNVIGLDGNDPVNSGPNTYMVGFRVSADGSGLSGYTAKIVEDNGVDVFGTGFLIGDSTTASGLDDGVDNIKFTGKGTAVGNLYTGVDIAANGYKDFYFNAEVLRNKSSIDQIQPFHFEFFKDTDGDGVWDSGEDGMKLEKFSWLPDSAAANTHLYLYVENFISQGRNEISTQTTGDSTDAAIRIDGIYDTGSNSYPASPITLFIGQTLNIRVEGATATSGYPQLTLSTTFDTDTFQINKINQAYAKPITNTDYQQDLGSGTETVDNDFSNITDNSSDDPNTSVYANPAGWNPATHSLMITSAPPKAGGGPIVTDYTVEVVGTGSGRLDTMILDYSGSSFHYNADFDSGTLGIQTVAFNAVQGAVVGSVGVDTDDDRLSNSALSGISVTLRKDADNNGSYETVVGTKTTDSNGKYIFTGLQPGKYEVTEGATTGYDDLIDYANGKSDGSNDNVVRVELGKNPDVATAGDLGGFTGVSNDTLLGYVRADFVEVGKGEADLSLTMSVNNSGPLAGSNIAFTLQVTNDGPDTASGVAVTTALDSNVGFTSYVTSIDGNTSSGGSYNSSTGLWSIGQLAPGETAVMVINATAPADMSSNSVNYAEITASSLADPDSSTGTNRNTDDLSDGKTDDDEASVTLASRISSNPDVELSLRVTDSNGNEIDLAQPIAANTTLVFTLVATNLSSSKDTGNPATIIIDFPESQLNLVSATPSSQADDIQFPNITSPTRANDWETTSQTNPNWMLWIADNGNANKLASGGTSATLTITATTKTAINVGDSMPFSAWWSNYGAYNDIDSSASGAAYNPTISDVATDDIPAAGGSADGVQPDDDEVSITISPKSPDLVLSKSVSNAKPDVGDTVTFTLTLKNTGTGDATGVRLVDYLPANLSYVSGTVSGNGVFSNNSTSGDTSDDTMTWSGLTVQAGKTRIFTFDAKVEGSAAITNAAEVTAADQADLDDTYGNRSGEDYATVSVDGQQVNLELAKTVTSGPTWNSAGGYYTVTFTLTATNKSTDDTATGVIVRDNLPTSLSYISDTGSGAYNSTTGRWNVGTLAPGASKSFTITARVNTAAALNNYAEIIAVDQPIVSGTLGNNSTTEPDDASASVNVELIDLSLSSTVNNQSPSVGNTLSYTVTLANASGFDTATGIQVTETVPAGLSNVTVTPSVGTYSNGVWSVSSLAAGASATLTISGAVTDLAKLKNIAEVTAATQHDRDSVPNNRSTEPNEDDTTVVSPSNLAYITGKVLDDAGGYTANKFDGGDSGVSGVTITLRSAGTDGSFDTSDDVTVTTTTDSSGTYEFYTAAGTYRIEETDKSGMVSIASLSSINTSTGAVTLDTSDPGFNRKSLTVTAGNEYYENNFLDLTPWSISGAVKLDSDGNNDFSSGDTGLSGVTLTLMQDTNNDGTFETTKATKTSGSDGSYSFTGLNSGSYRVVETDKANTTDVKDSDGGNADQINVTLKRGAGNSTGNNFLETDTQADLSIGISPSKSSAATGETITWTVTVTNQSSNNATGVAVKAVVPAGFKSIGNISNSGSESSGTVSWSGLTVNANSSITLTYTAVMQSSGSYSNATQVSAADQVDPDSTPNNDDGDQSEDDEAAASVTLSANRAPVAVDNSNSISEDASPNTRSGNVLTDLGSSDDSDADGNTLSVSAIRTGTEAGSGSSGTVDGSTVLNGTYGTLVIASNGAYTYTLNNGNSSVQALDAGASLTDTFTYTVSDGSATDKAALVITINGTNDAPAAGTALSNQTSKDGQSGISMSTAGAFTLVDSGDTVASYSASGLPSGLTINSSTGVISGTLDNSASQGGSSGVYTVTVTVTDSDGLTRSSSFSWTVSNVAVTATDNSNSLSRIATSAATGNVISDDNGNGKDRDGSPDSDTVVVSGIRTGTESGSGTAGTLGSALTGSYGSLTLNANGSYSYTVDTGNANVAALATGSTLSDTFTYTLSDNEGSTDTAQLVITIDGVSDSADLNLDKSVDNATPKVGETVVFTLTLLNQGPRDATGVSVSDQLPSGLSYVSDDSAGAYNASTGVWNVGNLANGASTSISITAKATLAASITNSASVASVDQTDPDSSDNSSSASVEAKQVDLVVAKLEYSISSTAQISEEGEEEASFTIELSGRPLTGSNTSSINISASGTAINEKDYSSFIDGINKAAAATAGVSFDGSSTLTFDASFNGGAGSGSFSFTVRALDDNLIERTETIIASLSNATVTNGTANIQTASTQTDIIQTDVLDYRISSTPSINEEGPDNTATFTITLGGGIIAGDNTSQVNISNGGTASDVATETTIATNLTGTNGSTTRLSLSALALADYSNFVDAMSNAAAGAAGVSFDGSTLTFDSSFNGGAGRGDFSFALTAIDDDQVEGTETIVVSLSNASISNGSATISVASAKTLINESDTAAPTAPPPKPPVVIVPPGTSGQGGVNSSNNSSTEGPETGLGNEARTGVGGGLINSLFPENTGNPAINPVNLSGQLRDQTVSEGQVEYVISDGEFTHTNIGAVLRYEAFIASGEPLPDYVEFDQESGTFVFDADRARGANINSLQIRVVASDSNGNNASSIFQVTFTNNQFTGSPLTTDDNAGIRGQGADDTALGASNTSFGTDLRGNQGISPLTLSGELNDLVVRESVMEYRIPEGTFRHTNPEEVLSFIAVLEDGSELPDYIVFDPAEQRFLVDADAARDAGVESVSVTVVVTDSSGNQVSSTFTITFVGDNAQVAPANPEIPVEDEQANPVDELVLLGNEDLAEQIRRAGEFAYQQQKKDLGAVLSAFFG